MFFRTVFITILSALFLFVGTAHSSPPVSKSDDPVEEESEFVIIPPISVAMYNKRKRPAGTMTIQMQLHIENDDQREEAKKNNAPSYKCLHTGNGAVSRQFF